MFLDIPLKETSIQRMKSNNYLSHLKTFGSSDGVQSFQARTGAGLYFTVSKQARYYAVYLRSHGCIINAHIVIAVGQNIIMSKN